MASMPEPMPGRSVLVSCLAEAFQHFEVLGLKVGTMWLHPDHMPALRADHACFDKMPPGHPMLEGFKDYGGTLEGFLFGALVFSSDLVPLGHVGIIPDGFRATIMGSEGCIPLGLS